MAYNKIIYGGTTLIDLTSDTITAADLLNGATAHGADGETITGSMPNRGAVSGTIAGKNDTYTIPAGYHNGQGSVGLSPAEIAKILPENIKQGITILSVQGTYAGEGVNLQTKSPSYTPATTAQTASVTADAGYDGLAAVNITVAAIPYSETPNSAGGITVTIG